MGSCFSLPRKEVYLHERNVTSPLFVIAQVIPPWHWERETRHCSRASSALCASPGPTSLLLGVVTAQALEQTPGQPETAKHHQSTMSNSDHGRAEELRNVESKTEREEQ